MPWITANGASLRYDLTGSGADTLVLIHEAGGCMESYDEVLPALQQHFRVLRFDQRGFGFSEKMKSITYDTVIADIAGLLDALGITEPVCMASCAMGCDFIVGFAAAHPEHVKRIALASPTIGQREGNAASSQARADLVVREGMRASMETSHARSWPPVIRERNLERFARYQARWVCNDPESFAAQGRMMSTIDLTPLYPRVKAKTLAIGDRHDSQRLPELAKKVAAAVPDGIYVEVDSGHFFALQSPEAFVETVVTWMK